MTILDKTLEERWKGPCCDLCGRNDVRLCDEHFFGSMGSMNFSWCYECEKNKEACDAVVGEAIKKRLAWQRQQRLKQLKVEVFDDNDKGG